MAKGKDYKLYEYGNKVSIARTAKANLIVGAVSHDQNLYDNRTLPVVFEHFKQSRGRAVEQALCDRGYRGKR